MKRLLLFLTLFACLTATAQYEQVMMKKDSGYAADHYHTRFMFSKDSSFLKNLIDALSTQMGGKQATLVNQSNIKSLSINGGTQYSLLGSGNLNFTISGGSSYASGSALTNALFWNPTSGTYEPRNLTPTDVPQLTLAHLASIAANTLLGNNTGATTTPSALSPAQVKAILAISTTDVAEGTGLYYTDARVRAAPLTGLSTTTSTAITASDDVVTAIGKAQAQINTFSSSTGANAAGTYIVQTATNAPTNAQVLASLGTGIVKNTTGTGALSIAVAGDFPTLNQNTTGTAANITASSNSTITTLPNLSLPAAQVAGNISGNAANVTGTVAVANGGTGQTTAQAAINNLMGGIGAGSVGKYGRSDGSNFVLSTIPAADIPLLNQNTTGTAASVTGTNVVTNANLAQAPANTLKGNNTGGTANEADLTVAQVKAMLNYTAGDISGVGTGNIIINTYTATGNSTWTKPANAQAVEVLVVGGGGGGGGGRKGASGSVRSGGGSGAAGGFSRMMFDASSLGATVTVTVGVGGTGGATQSTNSTSGNGGTNGGASSFGNFLKATGGNGGNPGGTGSSAGGANGQGLISSGGSGSSSNATGGTGTAGGTATYGASAGGSGGGVTTADAASAGGAGGAQPTFYNGAVAGGTAGSAGNSGGNGNSAWILGTGGGGGGGAISGSSGQGGNGGNYGAGGGGGGAGTDNAVSGGAGGNGAPGIVIVITHIGSGT